MKRITISILVLLLAFAVACSSPEPAVEPVEPEPAVAQEPAEPEPAVVEEPEPVELSCEDKALELFPDSLSLTMNQEDDPEADGWSLAEDAAWEDGTAVTMKGEIEFQKGRRANENVNEFYMRNNQNEKLFGAGGLVYEKQVTTEGGTVGTNRFMVAPVLNQLSINEPKPFEPYLAAFEITEADFIECSFAE